MSVDQVDVADQPQARPPRPLKVAVVIGCYVGMILPLPYAYYMLLRVLVSLSSVVVFVKGIRLRDKPAMWTFGALAILYNPIVPVHLGDKSAWGMINLATGLIFWFGTPRWLLSGYDQEALGPQPVGDERDQLVPEPREERQRPPRRERRKSDALWESRFEHEENDLPRREAALAYARRGWRVFPLHKAIGDRCTCRYEYCQEPGGHPRLPDGVAGATNDPAQVESWWQRWDGANIGIATGEESGLVVLEVRPLDGEGFLSAIEREIGSLPDTLQATTPLGGRQLYFRHPGGVRLRATALRDIRHLWVFGDRAAGRGWVVGPPAEGRLWMGAKEPAALSEAWIAKFRAGAVVDV